MPSVKEVKYEASRQPRQIRLDTTTRCNAKCLSCHRHISKRKGEMPFDMIIDIVNDVAKWQKPLEEIVPVNYGEFFMRKDWYEILQLITNKLPATTITLATNGYYCNEEVVAKL